MEQEPVQKHASTLFLGVVAFFNDERKEHMKCYTLQVASLDERYQKRAERLEIVDAVLLSYGGKRDSEEHNLTVTANTVLNSLMHFWVPNLTEAMLKAIFDDLTTKIANELEEIGVDDDAAVLA